MRLTKSNIWVYIIVAMAIYFSFLYYKTSADYSVLIKDEKMYNEKIAYEKEKREELSLVDEKCSSKKTIESMARNDLNYLKDGEILFIDGERAK